MAAEAAAAAAAAKAAMALEEEVMVETAKAEGVVEGVYIAEIAGAPMARLDEAEVIAHRGVKGDRCVRSHIFFSSLLSLPLRPPSLSLSQVYHAPRHLLRLPPLHQGGGSP